MTYLIKLYYNPSSAATCKLCNRKITDEYRTTCRGGWTHICCAAKYKTGGARHKRSGMKEKPVLQIITKNGTVLKEKHRVMKKLNELRYKGSKFEAEASKLKSLLTGKTPNLTNKSTRTTRSTSSGKSCHGPSQSASSNPATTNTTNTTTSTSITTTDTTNNTTAVNKTENLSQLMTGVMANDTLTQTACTAKIRRLLIGKMNPQEVIDMNIVPYFVEFLLRDDTPALQFEAAWVIACITCGTTEQTKVVVDHGAVPILVKLLSSKYDSVRGEAVWALLNIAGDSPAFRDLVLEAEVMNPLLKILQTSENQLSMIRDGVWLLMNLCNGKPQPNFERVRIAFPVLMELLSHNDEQVYGHSCWALSHLTDSPKNKFEDLIDDGVCLRLIELLEKSSHHMQKHASNSLLIKLKKMKY